MVMTAISIWLAMFLRVGSDILLPRYYPDLLITSTLALVGVAAVVYWTSGMYRGLWRYASLRDLITITRAVTLSLGIFLVLMFVLIRLEDLPRSVPFINWFVLMALLGGPRFLYRLLKDGQFDFSLRSKSEPRRIPVLLAGAGDGAEQFIRAMAKPGAHYKVVGCLARRSSRRGLVIHGVKVLGTLDDLEKVAGRLKGGADAPQRLILSEEDFPGEEIRTLLEKADRLGMTLARLPKLTEFKDGVSEDIEVKAVALEDLLGRPQAALDKDAMAAMIEGKRVLITGAGGSIGAELVRQISDYGPGHLTLLDHSEFNLYAVDLELAERHPGLPRSAVLADVRNTDKINGVFDEERPQVVFHAAALKHVPLVEANPFEGVLTNIMGTKNVADAAMAHKTGTMVMISTDKAVNPTSVMGATKRIAEQYCQAADVAAKNKATRFVTVRFGNVLGSTGSVVPLFQRQLAKGGPLTVTHPEVTRYFMTIREAVQLVLQAAVIGRGKEVKPGRIMVLDMGEPVKIADLADQMIRLAGLKPGSDVTIEYTGLRPGEKLYEEVLHEQEGLVPTAHESVLTAAPRTAGLDQLTRRLSSLIKAAENGSEEKLRKTITTLVPEYQAGAQREVKAAQ